MKASARRKRSTVSRLRPFWIVWVIVAGCIAWAAIATADNPAFYPKRLTVTGLSHVTRTAVVARASIDPHANVWLLNKRAIEARIEAIPYVAFATVHRRFLGDVRIDVSERVAVACLRGVQGHAATIDRDNRILENDCASPALVAYDVRDATERPAGVFVRDGELTELETDAAALAVGGSHFHAFAHDRFGQLVATMSDGIAVQFGDDGDLERKKRLIGPILAQLGSRAIDVKSVDLRAPATPVVEYRASCASCTPPN